ncbi:MAG: NUDIX hydrolase [Lachnospiraceae bacterium]|nr:NUDIX hydrolase [Lachnospiraceae bacterium]
MRLLRIESSGGGNYLKHYELVYENRAGKEKHFEIVSHREHLNEENLGEAVSGVSVVAFCGGKLLLLREFRMGVNRYVYNLCAGMLEAGEGIEECVRREMYEETGLRVTKIHEILPPCYAAVTLSDIRNCIVYAEVEGTIGEHASANEEIKAGLYSREEVAELIREQDFTARAQVVAHDFVYFGSFSGKFT